MPSRGVSQSDMSRRKLINERGSDEQTSLHTKSSAVARPIDALKKFAPSPLSQGSETASYLLISLWESKKTVGYRKSDHHRKASFAGELSI